jgi:photosystem II stability/assembly factor-like uncharacterized protein
MPTTQMPTTRAPTTQMPTTQMPTTQMPTTQMPTTLQPTTQMPTTRAPTTQIPTTQMPTTQMPTTQMPTTRAPTTQIPTTLQPTTQMPTTQMPTTRVPTTQMPTTQMPTTQMPTTSNPTLKYSVLDNYISKGKELFQTQIPRITPRLSKIILDWYAKYKDKVNKPWGDIDGDGTPERRFGNSAPASARLLGDLIKNLNKPSDLGLYEEKLIENGDENGSKTESLVYPPKTLSEVLNDIAIGEKWISTPAPTTRVPTTLIPTLKNYLGKTFIQANVSGNTLGIISNPRSYWSGGISISSNGQYAIFSTYGAYPSSDRKTGGEVYYTKNYGINWILSTGLPTTYFLPRKPTMSSTGEYCVVGNVYNNDDESIYYSRDYGKSFTKVSNLPTTNYYESLCISDSGNTIIAVGQQTSNIYVSTDGAKNWTPTQVGGKKDFWEIASTSSAGLCYLATSFGIYKSENTREKWINISTPTTPSPLSTYGLPKGVYRTCCMTKDGKKILVGQNPGGLYYSTDSGTSFKLIESVPQSAEWYCSAISTDGKHIAAGISKGLNSTVSGDGGGLYMSSDSGATWIKYTASPLNSTLRVDSIAIQNNLLILTTSDPSNSAGNIYISYNNS